MLSNIKVRAFTGAGIKTYIPSIAKLRTEGNESSYLKKYPQCKEAIAVVIFDGPKIVGAATGLPLEEERADLHKPILEKGDEVAKYYYFGDCILQKPYLSRGIGHHFFDLREEHVKHLKRYKYICFFQPKGTKDTLSIDAFLKKRGYVPFPEKDRVLWIKEI